MVQGCNLSSGFGIFDDDEDQLATNILADGNVVTTAGPFELLGGDILAGGTLKNVVVNNQLTSTGDSAFDSSLTYSAGARMDHIFTRNTLTTDEPAISEDGFMEANTRYRLLVDGNAHTSTGATSLVVFDAGSGTGASALASITVRNNRTIGTSPAVFIARIASPFALTTTIDGNSFPAADTIDLDNGLPVPGFQVTNFNALGRFNNGAGVTILDNPVQTTPIPAELP